MKKRELINLINRFQELDNLSGVHFSYTVNYNKKLLKNEYELLINSNLQSNEYSEFLEKEKDLIKQYSVKDENGNIKQVKYDDGNVGVTIIPEQLSLFHTQHNELQQKYSKYIQEYENQQIEFNKLLDEDIDSELKYIDLIYIPDLISVKQMEIVEHFIKN